MRRGILTIVCSLALTACAQAAGSEVERISDAAIDVGTAPPIPQVVESTTTIPDRSTTTPKLERPIYEGFAAELGETASLVAATRGATVVYDGPGSETELLTLNATTILGTGTVLSVVGEGPNGWLEVLLPVRPNDGTGWIRPDDVELYVVEGHITIDLSDRELNYIVNGETVLTSTVAVGKPHYPTPTGHFFVTDSVAVSSAGGPWGPHALGLSARSETITEFNGGDGIIGIHGTNNPSSIGKAASLGCVRLPNDLITELFNMVPIGTTVEIRA